MSSNYCKPFKVNENKNKLNKKSSESKLLFVKEKRHVLKRHSNSKSRKSIELRMSWRKPKE